MAVYSVPHDPEFISRIAISPRRCMCYRWRLTALDAAKKKPSPPPCWRRGILIQDVDLSQQVNAGLISQPYVLPIPG